MKRFVFFSIFNAKYFFNKSTATQSFRNPVKYNWSSTRKTKKKNLLGLILQDITPWNHKNVRNCYFGEGGFGGLGTNVEFQWFFMILQISENFSLYLLVKNSSNFKLGFFHLFWIYFRGYYQRWHWCKKVQKNLPQTWDFERLKFEMWIFFLNA